MTGSLRAVVIKLFIFSVVTLSLTGLLAAVIGNIQPFTRFYSIQAEFSDATGLLEADVVKVAGVTVGRVGGARIVLDEETGRASAFVTIQIRRDIDVPRNAHAEIRFRNLLGQRMVVISRDADEADEPALPKDGTAVIPLARTSPSFDLGIVFNNLRPVLRTLEAEDLNTVSRAIVQIFGGREQRVQQMVSDLADLSESLAARGAVVTEFVGHLAEVARIVAARDDQLASVIDSLDAILVTLADKGDELARAADNLGVASEGTAAIIADNRPGLDQLIRQLRDVLAVVAAHRADLEVAIQQLPSTAHALNRATTYGSWANLTGVCINQICAPGLTSSSSDETSSPLADIFLSSVRGAVR